MALVSWVRAYRILPSFSSISLPMSISREKAAFLCNGASRLAPLSPLLNPCKYQLVTCDRKEDIPFHLQRFVSIIFQPGVLVPDICDHTAADYHDILESPSFLSKQPYFSFQAEILHFEPCNRSLRLTASLDRPAVKGKQLICPLLNTRSSYGALSASTSRSSTLCVEIIFSRDCPVIDDRNTPHLSFLSLFLLFPLYTRLYISRDMTRVAFRRSLSSYAWSRLV